MRARARALAAAQWRGNGRFDRAALLWYCAAVGGVAIGTLLIALVHPHLPAARLQMSYLLLVLALAVGGGRGPAILASVLAVLAFDWFFVTPEGTLGVDNPDELFALGLFLIVGVTTGSLAAGLKRSVAEARRRAQETATLYELSTAMLADVSLDHVLDVVVTRLVATLGLHAATVQLAEGDGVLRLAAYSASSVDSAPTGVGWTPPGPDIRDRIVCDAAPRDAFSTVMTAPLVDPGVSGPAGRPLVRATSNDLRGIHLPLALNGRALGVLSAYTALAAPPLSEEGQRLLTAFGAQTALAVGRLRLIEEEERAHAAAESNRLKSIFLASISHDLRTPLTAIKTAAALLVSEPKQAARLEAKAGIDQQVERLNHLVGNLIEMSGIESGSAPPNPAPVDLAELVGAVAERLRPLLGGRRLDLSATDDLPLVWVDAGQIDRVLTNLLENAIKFSPAGASISVGVSDDGAVALVRVHNAGRPIPTEEQPHIFDKFYRVQRDRPGVGGSGLGLAICKGIVEAHGGRIWTRNEDRGVAFYVSLPAIAPARPVPERREAVTVQ